MLYCSHMKMAACLEEEQETKRQLEVALLEKGREVEVRCSLVLACSCPHKTPSPRCSRIV